MTFPPLPPLSEQNCSNCRYFLAVIQPIGLCRRNPPQIGSRGEQWPEITKHDWCGEWVAREGE
jgi:hypothetical protein